MLEASSLNVMASCATDIGTDIIMLRLSETPFKVNVYCTVGIMVHINAALISLKLPCEMVSLPPDTLASVSLL